MNLLMYQISLQKRQFIHAFILDELVQLVLIYFITFFIIFKVVLGVFLMVFVKIIFGHFMLGVVELGHVAAYKLHDFSDFDEILVRLGDNHRFSFCKHFAEELFNNESPEIAIIVAQV